MIPSPSYNISTLPPPQSTSPPFRNTNYFHLPDTIPRYSSIHHSQHEPWHLWTMSHFEWGMEITLRSAQNWVLCSVSNGSSVGPGRLYGSVWQHPYTFNNRRFLKRTITLRLQTSIPEFSVWYVEYSAPHGASFGSLGLSISSNLSTR